MEHGVREAEREGEYDKEFALEAHLEGGYEDGGEDHEDHFAYYVEGGDDFPAEGLR